LEAPRPSCEAYRMELPGEAVRFMYCGPHPLGSGHFAGTMQNRYGSFPMGKGKSREWFVSLKTVGNLSPTVPPPVQIRLPPPKKLKG
jgi:hypothetical protein